MVGTFVALIQCVEYLLGDSCTLHTCHSHVYGILPLEACETLVSTESS